MRRHTPTWLVAIGLSTMGVSVLRLSASERFALGVAALGVAASVHWWHGSHGSVRRRWSRVGALALAVVLVLTSTLGGALGGSAPISYAATDLRPMPTHRFTLAPQARAVAAHWSRTVAPRSAAEATQLQANLARMQRLQPPPLALSTQKAVDPARLNPPLAAPARRGAGRPATQPAVFTGPLADGDPVIEQSNTGNASGGPSYPCTLAVNNCSMAALEPSVAGDGGTLMESYNWYDALSKDGGATWTYLNPATQFTSIAGVGRFGGDQQVLYEPSRNTMYWEQLYEVNPYSPSTNPAGVGIGIAAGSNLSVWSCFYYLTPATIGYPSTDSFGEGTDLEFTNDYLFLSFNDFGATVTSGVVRMPLTAMSRCGTFSGSVTGTTANFQFALTQGAQGTMWFVSDAYISGSGTGSSLRMCQWQDPASSPSCVDRAIPAFNPIGTKALNCGSQDGVVLNWCIGLDSRARSVFFTKANFRGFGPATLGVALTVGPAGADPYPWVAIYYFEVAGLVYTAEDALYNNGFAIAWPSFASNFRGFLGFTAAFGGGTGTGSGAIDYYPSTLYGLEDPANPTPPFYTWADIGAANTPEWGRYTTRPLYPSALQFLAGVWALDKQGNVLVGEAVIDRGRDHGAYLRWYLS